MNSIDDSLRKLGSEGKETLARGAQSNEREKSKIQ